jgi:hypothetical protein
MQRLSRAALAAALSFVTLSQARTLPDVDALANHAPKAKLETKAMAAPDALSPSDPLFLRANYEDRLGVPTMLWLRKGALPAAKAGVASPEAAARAHLKTLAPKYGLSAADIDNAPLHHVDSLGNGATLARFTNQRDGIEVFRESVAVLMDAQKQAVAVGGFIAPTGLDTAALKASPAMFRLTPAEAIATALADHGFEAGIANELQIRVPSADAVAHAVAGYSYFRLPKGRTAADGTYLVTSPRAKKVWFRLPEGLVPAYFVETETVDPAAGTDDFYGYVIAADDGRLLFRMNESADAGFTYRTYAEDLGINLPYPGPQRRGGTPHPTGLNDGFQAAFGLQNDVTLLNGPISTNDPWLDPVADRTIGNNVEAWANHFGPAPVPPATDANDSIFDLDPNECDVNAAQVKDFHACVQTPGAFTYTFNPTLTAMASKIQVMSAVVNLFYMNNWLHDWYYDAGFREVDGNAQTNNYGRGGLGNDSIRALGQDYTGTNNANMSTPSDGNRPRMRMYVFTGSGAARLFVNSPAAIQGTYVVGVNSTFGPNSADVTADVVQALDAADAAGPATTDGCTAPLTNAAALVGKIAIIDRGTCGFAVKVKNAQDAGALGVIIANSSAGAFGNLGGVDPTVTIPAMLVSFADGNSIKGQLASGVNATMKRVTGVDRDGTVDNGIIAHEWGHYISNRLVNNANGLSTGMSRGMGEGWADFHALLLMAKEEDALVAANANWTGTYAIGGYTADGPQIDGVTQSIAYYAGIRRYPYTRDLTKNPLTFKHIQTAQALPASPAPFFTGDNAEVHNTGEVWASSLWQCYTGLLRDTPRLTFAEAQDRMKKYLVAGYKLTPVAPTLIEARDAILAAMAAVDTSDMLACQIGFAERGLGMRAQFTGSRFSATNAGVVENFSAGSDAVVNTLKFDGTAGEYCDADQFLDDRESGLVSVKVTNTGAATLTGSTMTFSSASSGISFPDGPTVSVPDLAPGASATVGLMVALANTTPLFTPSITATLTNGSLALGPVAATFALPANRDRVANTSNLDDAEGPVDQWTVTLPVGTDNALKWKRVERGTYDHYWNAPTSENNGVTWLTSPSLVVGTNLTMQFSHRFNFEFGSANFDGGVIEVSQDDGATWQDIEAVLGATSVYNGTIYNGNPLGNGSTRRGFVNVIANYPAMTTRTISFPASLNGKTVRVRFGVGSDDGGHLYGWDLDDISFGGLTNSPFSGVTANSGTCVSVTASSGSDQSTVVNTPFAAPLQAQVTLNGTPMPGLPVRFVIAQQSNVAGGLFGGQSTVTATTDGSGIAVSPTVTANGTAGQFHASASAGLYTTIYLLTNTPASSGSVSWDATTYDFGYQSYGTTSAGHTFTLTNGTSSSIPLTSLTPSNQNFSQSGGTCQFDAATPGSLAPGASCTVVATFNPQADPNVALNAQVAMTGQLTPVSSGGAPTLDLSGTAEKNLVTHYYRSILRREPDAGGKVFWTQLATQLTAKSIDVNEVWYAMAQSFYGSPEYGSFNRDDTGFLTDLYTTFFNRAPDAGGLGFWVSQLQAGMPREVVLASFMFSPEFSSFTQGIFGNTAARPEVNLVMDMYRGLLGRTPDSGGFDFWVARLRAAQCAGAGAVYTEVENLSSGFLNSGEFVNRNRSDGQFVGDLYNAFLRRGGDNGGVQFWIGQVGTMGRNGERQQFIATSEFGARVNAVIAAGCAN